MKISPFAPKNPPNMPTVEGVELAVGKVGVKYKNRADVLLCHFAKGTVVAGTFTRSKTASGAVEWCRKNLAHGKARGLIVNSGNANAFTGKLGEKSVRVIGRDLAKLFGSSPRTIYQSSTGVIGEPLDHDKIIKNFERLNKKLSARGYEEAATAIMTTDTYPKFASRKIEIEGETITINGIAKGSGMIAPDMATMLAYIFTDAPIAVGLLQNLISKSVERSFNAITVDGDTSTSDTVLAFATGKAKISELKQARDSRVKQFRSALEEICEQLALMIVKDGEGLTKFVTINVKGAVSQKAAKNIAFSIANSPLVKTAIAGEDPNWGRIVMAVGKAGEAADRDKLSIWIGGQLVTHKGGAVDDYDEAPLARYMKGEEIEIEVDIGLGKGAFKVWTCDLTHDYISINADYRS